MIYRTYERWKPVAIEVSAWVLAISASMILGLLSFSGMLAIFPTMLSFACAAFIFAVVIEGEIYLESVRSALGKLTDTKAYEHQLSALYLQERLADFDKNRDVLLLRNPSPAEQEQVCEYNQVLLIRKGNGVEIGFRKQLSDGKYVYVQQCLNEDQSRFLKHYSQQEQFLEVPGHHEHIQRILQTLDPTSLPRPQIAYPLFMKLYISQCQYVRRLNCYLHTQPPHAQKQEELAVMTAHLSQLEDEVCEELFHGVSGEASSTSNENVSAMQTFNQKNNTYDLNLETMVFQPKPALPQFTFIKPRPRIIITDTVVHEKDILESISNLSDEDTQLRDLSDRAYAFHRQKLADWLRADRDAWKRKLTAHTLHSRLAFLVSAVSGLVMGIGTTYLIMESMAAVPFLAAIPLSFFPPVIAPLALIAGAAYGLLIYNSLTEILLDDPFKKFFARIRENLHFENMTLKKAVMLALSVSLLIVTLLLTICTAGTWLTVFHKTKPLFTWIGHIPNVLLNIIIPILIGISVLPFSIQSISNTLDNLDTNASFDALISACNPMNWGASTSHFPRSWEDVSAGLRERVWQHWIPEFLGVTALEFGNETLQQQRNPYRILYRLLFEPLRALIFIGHLISAGATSDQIEGVPIIVSFLLNFFFEFAEDWDWIMKQPHAEAVSTADILKERAQKTDDHNHDNNIPMRILKFIFEPILKRAAQWDNNHRREGEVDNVAMRYERIKLGLQPKHTAVEPSIPHYRKQSNFNLFLFKSAACEARSALRDTCCTNLLTV